MVFEDVVACRQTCPGKVVEHSSKTTFIGQALEFRWYGVLAFVLAGR